MTPEIRRQRRDRSGYRPRYQIVRPQRPTRRRSVQQAQWACHRRAKLLLSDVRRMRARWMEEQAWLSANRFAGAEVARLALEGVIVSRLTIRNVLSRDSWAWDP